jgi:FixJ family two-component response regulator
MERRLKQAGYEVATYPSALYLSVNLPAESIPSCILLDVQIPGLDGPGLQKQLAELGSTLPIIFITGNPDVPTTVRAIKAGADDFLIKPVASDDLISAIEQALAHHRTLRDLKDKLDSVRARVGRLTPREREVFELVVRGEPNKQIARAIGCTERTVKAHRHNVMEKMQVKSTKADKPKQGKYVVTVHDCSLLIRRQTQFLRRGGLSEAAAAGLVIARQRFGCERHAMCRSERCHTPSV